MSDSPSAPGSASATPRSADDIEADLAQTRERLASTIDTLQDRVRPENIAKRSVAKVKGIYVDEHGGIRPERVAATAVAVVGLLLLRRGLRSWSRQRAMAAVPDVVWVPVPKSQVPASLADSAR